MKSVFKKLSPINNANITGYEDALDFVFSDEDIKNIAISGPYSSGKSSIVETYEIKHKDRLKLLHISLAHFCAKMNNSECQNKKKCNEETIESKILNQLLQQISHSNIPLTKFKVKEANEERPIIAISLLLSLLFFSVIYVIKFKSWCNWVFSINQDFFRNILMFSTEPFFRIAITFIVLFVSAIFIYLIVRTQVFNRIIRKICFKDYEIEIGQDNEDSFFDKYMDEIIYIFENAGVDGIVFEDLDRFEDLTVFERIREINTLANIRLKREKKKTIRFFYLLRDDIFVKSKDRTKFFDFVIPVIPVVDGSNSYNLIINYLKEAELYDHYDDSFLRLLSLYIDDLRITKNIINELLVFLNNLEGIDLDYNKMLAIITYKNIFLKDYYDLQLNKGYVHAIFDAKNTVKEAVVKQLNAEIANIQSDIKDIDNELLESSRELEDVKSARYSNRQHYKEDYNTWIKTSYPRRKAAIEARSSGQVKELEEKLSTIKSRISLLDEYSLSELIANYPKESPFDKVSSGKDNCFVDIINDSYFDLLKFLLSDGYIDETYPDYMTYFYPNSLSKNDKIFLRSVTDRRAKDFGYRLDNPMLIIRYLRANDFSHNETLNFDLYDLIFSGEYPQHINNAISLLMTGDHNDFIEFYILSSDKADKFVLSVVEKWPEFFKYSVSELKDDVVEEICYILVNYCDEEMLKQINIFDNSTDEGVLTRYISSQSNFLSKEYIHDATCRALSLLKVSFKEIIYDSAIDELFDYVYQNDLYEINYSNICLMLREKCDIKDVQQQLKTFYSFIRNNKNLRFCQYASENISTTMSVYLDAFNEDIGDDQDSAVELINEVNPEMAVKYIERLTTKVESAKSIIDTSLLSVLLRQRNLLYSANNILFCFKEKYELYPDLVDFINSNKIYVDYKTCEEFDDSSATDFLSKILNLDTIKDYKYLQIVDNISNRKIDITGNSKIPETKMKLLINKKCLVASESTLINIRKFYPQFIPTFIALYYKEYMELSPAPWTNDEMNIILSQTSIADSDKISILKGYNGAISVVDKSFSSEITETILENNFDEQDLKWICQNYSSLPNKNQALVLVINNIRKVIESNYSCEFELIIDALKSTMLGFDNKMNMVDKFLDGIKKEELYDILSALGFYSLVQNLKGKNVKVIVNQENKIIVELLASKNIIQHCTVTPSGKYYQRIKFSGTYM